MTDQSTPDLIARLANAEDGFRTPAEAAHDIYLSNSDAQEHAELLRAARDRLAQLSAAPTSEEVQEALKSLRASSMTRTANMIESLARHVAELERQLAVTQKMDAETAEALDRANDRVEGAQEQARRR